MASGREAQINAVAAVRRTLLRRYLAQGTIALRDKVLEAYQPVVLLHARRVYRRQKRFTRLTLTDYEGQANLVFLELLADREALGQKTNGSEQAFVELISCCIRRQLTLIGIQTSSVVSLTTEQAWTVNRRSHRESTRHFGTYEDLRLCLYSEELGDLESLPAAELPEVNSALDDREREDLLRAVEHLPELERELVRLRYGIGMGTAGGGSLGLVQISAEMGLSKSQVHRRLSRALSLLSWEFVDASSESERVLKAS